MTSSAKPSGLAGLVVTSLAVAALIGFSGDTPAATTTTLRASLRAGSVEANIASVVAKHPGLASVYRERSYRPMWTAGAPERIIQTLAAAGADGLDPASYGIDRLRTLPTDPVSAAERDVALAQAFADYVRDLRTPSPGSRMTYVDAALAPETRPAAVLAAAAAAPSLSAHLERVQRMHPLYEGLRAALAAYRTLGANPSTLAGTSYERLLLANMDRLRALPADPGRRYALVDTASARLWMYEDGEPRDMMRVIVGKQRLPTPQLAGLIRFAVRNPYWNLPPDLVRARAAEVVRNGPGIIERERLELLTDWSPTARILDPLEIDWAAVAQGRQKLRMRQLPGPDNMMGQVKFMLPNRLGIYLHDTPDKAAFTRDDRRLSSGCVRLEDAARFGEWLFGRSLFAGWAGTEERVDLHQAVPVYIVYLTAIPHQAGVVVQPDRYGRDKGK
ncbi:L,D-transpeptidase family protein [Sphingomonas sp.]|jgi:murein L,D-transpeptidase YcbB/YkuD|uniref:L,D-transpeptidase family protein n=1 Tax=Sphingomonas sp. TaxID=28214 RepID=UPI002ED84E47